MRVPKRIAIRPHWRLPGRTVRLRLTLLYGALFLVSGAALLTITYVLVAHQYTGDENIFDKRRPGWARRVRRERSGQARIRSRRRRSCPCPPKGCRR